MTETTLALIRKGKTPEQVATERGLATADVIFPKKGDLKMEAENGGVAN